MNDVMQSLYDLAERPESLVELLNSLPFDELVEIDLANNHISNLYHVEGKYYVPVFDGSYQDLYRFSNVHMVHPDDHDIHADLMEYNTLEERLACADIPGVLTAKFRYRLQNDDWRWVRQIVVGGARHGLPPGVVRFYVFDIQHAVDREAGATAGSAYRPETGVDKTTGLLREKEFLGQLSAYLAGHDCADWCLIAIDIAQFKLLNEWYGREAGDFVLARIGTFLADRKLSDCWLVGYLGQDDFCVAMPYSEEAVEALYSDITGIIAAYGTSMSFMPIFGISMMSASPTGAVLDLLDCAMLALASASGDFRHPVRMFEPAMYQETEAEYRLLDDFQQAIANHEISYYVQPQCRISTGKIVGVEALARWHKADGTVVPPVVFVPVLEKYGFITDLDRYIWEDACVHLRRWLDAGHAAVPISVNVSKQDIYAMDVAAHFEKLTEKYGIPHSLVKVEVTESAYADDAEKVNDTVSRLRDKGFVVLMDDFGSGYSSLNMLDSINVDVIKLDMMFMHMDDENKRKGIHIVESVVNMAKTMELVIITEGVETAEQVEFLRSLGCRYVQGFYYYKPMPSEDFEQLIADESLIDKQGFTVKANDEFRLREFLDGSVYSDSMLNSILGAVALFSWDGENVDITRFNEQFYETVELADFDGRTRSLQQVVDRKDRARLVEALEQASHDTLNGSEGMLRFRKTDNTPIDILAHFFFLGEENGVKRFYASVHNVTQINQLRGEMKLLSQVTDKSIAFLKKEGGAWRYNVEIHGLAGELGLTRREFERELESGAFFSRVDGPEEAMLRNLALDSGEVDEHFTLTFGMTNARGEHIDIEVRYFCVEDVAAGFSYILMFEKDAS